MAYPPIHIILSFLFKIQYLKSFSKKLKPVVLIPNKFRQIMVKPHFLIDLFAVLAKKRFKTATSKT
jgi:hypothetical protein